MLSLVDELRNIYYCHATLVELKAFNDELFVDGQTPVINLIGFFIDLKHFPLPAIQILKLAAILVGASSYEYKFHRLRVAVRRAIMERLAEVQHD